MEKAEEEDVEKAEEKEETVEKTEEYSSSMQQAMGTCKLRFLLTLVQIIVALLLVLVGVSARH